MSSILENQNLKQSGSEREGMSKRLNGAVGGIKRETIRGGRWLYETAATCRQ